MNNNNNSDAKRYTLISYYASYQPIAADNTEHSEIYIGISNDQFEQILSYVKDDDEENADIILDSEDQLARTNDEDLFSFLDKEAEDGLRSSFDKETTNDTPNDKRKVYWRIYEDWLDYYGSYNDDTTTDIIEGEGCERYISFLDGDTRVTLDIYVTEESFICNYKELSIGGGYVEKYMIENVVGLLNLFGVTNKDDLISAIMEKCKYRGMPLNVGYFLDLLNSNNIAYQEYKIGTYDVNDDDNGNTNAIFRPID